MSTPIYKISERAPEFPCWLWSWLEGEWQQREHLIGDVDTLYDFTHWCHSETRPTVTPDAGSKLDALFKEIRRAGVYDAELTPSAPDVQRVAEEIACDLFTRGDGEKAERLVMERGGKTGMAGWCKSAVRDRITAILTRYAAAQEDTKRLDWVQAKAVQIVIHKHWGIEPTREAIDAARAKEDTRHA